MLDRALEPALDHAAGRRDPASALGALTILDPACGDGNFLVAAAARVAARLVAAGLDANRARRVAAGTVHGVDVDPVAVATCVARLGGVAPHVRVADWLAQAPPTAGTFDVVVGNPPFLTPLRRDRRSVAPAGPGGAYTDAAGRFLARAVAAARPDGGRVAMVQPASVLASRDGGPVRDAVGRAGALDGLWWSHASPFDADVVVCVVSAVRGAPPQAVPRWWGPAFTPAAPAPPPAPGATWAALGAGAAGTPHPPLRRAGTLGDRCEVAVDFRQHYYALAGALVADDGAAPGAVPLVTSGAIDPARSRWGSAGARVAGAVRVRPRVDLDALDVPMRAWATRRLVPKVLVAQQCRVPEAVVDAGGCWLPGVPVLTVSAAPDDLWRVAAALTSPVLAAVAATRHAGTGRSAAAVRLRPADLAALPAPVSQGAWEEGAAHVRAAHTAAARGDATAWREALSACGAAMTAAYNVRRDDPCVTWWERLLPRWR